MVMGPLSEIGKVEITRLPETESYEVRFPDGLVIRMQGSEINRGEDIIQAAWALRKRAGI